VIPAGWDGAAGPITVGFGSDLASDDALVFAVNLADRTKKSLRLTHVRNISAGGISADETAVSDDLLRVLDARARELRASNPELEITVDERVSDIFAGLADAGEESSVLVLGRRHHTAIGRILGSTSVRVLAELPCPVILVPHKDGLRVSPDVTHEDL